MPSPVETNHNSLASYTEVPTRIDDIGEALPRPAEPSEVAEDFQLQQPVKPVLAVSNKSSASQTLNVTEPEKKMKKKKKQKEKGSETKKRRKENAIDDLFDGLF